jgi:hypothetical protein
MISLVVLECFARPYAFDPSGFELCVSFNEFLAMKLLEFNRQPG